MSTADVDRNAAPPHWDLAGTEHPTGQLVGGKYRLVRRLAEGAMGAIWEARDEHLDRPVAVKLLRPDQRASALEWSYLTQRLLREAQITSTVRHPAIVRALEFGVTAYNDPFLVMELLAGETFDHHVRPGRAMSPRRAVQLLLPIADGLAAVHAHGIVHRDVKPENLFLAWGPIGTVLPKVTDFGVAKLLEPPRGERLTGAGLIGTPEYMAPEQAIDSSDVDPRADIWAYCVVMYEALSGSVPFAAHTCADVLRAVLSGEVPPLTAKIDLDPALWAILERGLRRERGDRWPDMRELGAALAGWLETSRAD